MANISPGLPTPSSIDVQDNLKPFSCLLCRQRKVKCSRTEPCRVCVRAGVECEYVAPAPARRRGPAREKEGLHARLRRYEKILQDYKLKPDSLPSPERDSDEEDRFIPRREGQAEAVPSKRGKLVSRKGSSRYLDSEMWNTLTKELDDPTELFSDGSEDDASTSPHLSSAYVQTDGYSMLFSGARDNSLYLRHPDRARLYNLWAAFCRNVDPIMKIVHPPSLRATVNRAADFPQQLCKSEEALLFTIYLVTILSWTSEECWVNIGERRDVAISRYRALAQQGFVNASLLKTTNLTTLQAFCLYLLSLKSLCDSGTLLTLSAVALRIARRIGLHRDGTFLNISPFETEMRRRLWWHIVLVEYKLAEICGTRHSADLVGDTRPASNVNDSDLDPDMQELPTERDGLTDMVFVSAKTMALEALGKLVSFPEATEMDAYSIEDRDTMVDRLQELHEQRIHRYCDPLDPLQVFASIMSRGIVCKLRVGAHSPLRYAEKNIPMPQSARDIIWQHGKKLIDYANLLHSAPMLDRFRWSIGPQFMWDSFIYILGELRHRKKGPDVDSVWEKVAVVFDNYPDTSIDANNPNFLAVGIWTLRVWDDTAVARFGSHSTSATDPPFITRLRRGRDCSHATLVQNSDVQQKRHAKTTQQMPTGDLVSSNGSCDTMTLPSSCSEFDDMFNVPLDGFDWAQFDQFFQ